MKNINNIMLPEQLYDKQLNLRPQHGLRLLGLTKLILLSLTFSSSSYAALTATTAKTIQGTPPYLSYDGGTTITTSTDELVKITLSNGTTYTKSQAAATENAPIVLPVGDTTLASVVTYIPSGSTSVSLTDVFGAPNNYAMDDDGDNNFTATSDLTIIASDVDDNVIALTDILDPCKTPYKITLSVPTGTLSSTFGDPNTSTYTAATATYHIYNSATPAACFAKPNLTYSEGIYAAPAGQWESGNGFIPQIETSVGTTNFPTTGFNGAFFDVILANTIATDVITTTGNVVSASSGASNVNLKLSAVSTNVLRVQLEGPSSGQTNGLGTIAVTGLPAKFELKSGSTKIYSFTLSKWYIPVSGGVGGYPAAKTYCDGLAGGSYRMPTRVDYSNNPRVFSPICPGDGTDYTNAGSAWCSDGGTYSRAIGSSVFSEWGSVIDDSYSLYYTDSDWDFQIYWTSDYKQLNDYLYISDGMMGSIGSSLITGSVPGGPIAYDVACVSP